MAHLEVGKLARSLRPDGIAEVGPPLLMARLQKSSVRNHRSKYPCLVAQAIRNQRKDRLIKVLMTRQMVPYRRLTLMQSISSFWIQYNNSQLSLP